MKKLTQAEIVGGFNRENNSLIERYVMKSVYNLKYLIPNYIKSWHLTILTPIYGFLIILFSYLSQFNLNWLWLNSILVTMQFITDCLDGEIGRFRKTGLIKWGFYVDHFFDYIFVSCVFIGFYYIFPTQKILCLIILIIIAAFFIHESFKSLALFQKYHVSGYYGFGGTELKALIILINTLVIFLPSKITQWFPIPIFIISFISLILIFYQTQKRMWKLDMVIKNRKK